MKLLFCHSKPVAYKLPKVDFQGRIIFTRVRG